MLQYSIFSEKEREVNVWVAFYDITQLVWDRVHQICLLLFVGVKKKLKLKKVARINESGIIVTHTKVLKRILESSVLLLSATLEGQLEHWSPSSDRRKAKPETQKVLQSVLHRKKEAVQFASAKRSGKEKYTSRVGLHWTLFKIMITLYKKKEPETLVWSKSWQRTRKNDSPFGRALPTEHQHRQCHRPWFLQAWE